MIKHVYHRSIDYDKVYHRVTAKNKENITDNVDENITINDDYNNKSFYESDSWFEFEEIPVMSGK